MSMTYCSIGVISMNNDNMATGIIAAAKYVEHQSSMSRRCELHIVEKGQVADRMTRHGISKSCILDLT